MSQISDSQVVTVKRVKTVAIVDAGNPQTNLQPHSDGNKTRRDEARVGLFTFFWERTFSGLVSPSGLPEKNSSLVQIGR